VNTSSNGEGRFSAYSPPARPRPCWPRSPGVLTGPRGDLCFGPGRNPYAFDGLPNRGERAETTHSGDYALPPLFGRGVTPGAVLDRTSYRASQGRFRIGRPEGG
jgi:hypothetical protein